MQRKASLKVLRAVFQRRERRVPPRYRCGLGARGTSGWMLRISGDWQITRGLTADDVSLHPIRKSAIRLSFGLSGHSVLRLEEPAALPFFLFPYPPPPGSLSGAQRASFSRPTKRQELETLCLPFQGRHSRRRESRFPIR